MNEEFGIKLKFIMDESSIASIKEKVGKVSNEFGGNTTRKVVDRSNSELSRLEKRYNELLEKMKQFQLGANLTFKPTDKDWIEFDKWEAEAISIQDKMEQMKNATGEVADNVKEIVNDFEIHAKDVEKTSINWKDLVKNGKQMLLGLIGIRSVYSLIRTAMSTYLAQNEELKNQMSQLYYTLGSAFEPILRWIVRILATIVLYVDYILRAFGLAGLKMDGFAKGAGSASKSLNKSAKDAKEINKQLAGFDEINNLNKNTPTDDIGGGGGGGGGSVWDDSFIQQIKQRIDIIAAILSGALMVIGAILVFTGANVPLGLGMIAVGAIGLAAVVKTNWNEMPEKLRKVLSVIMIIVSSALIALGTVLILTSPTKLALGIALIAVGAATLVTAVAVNWNSSKSKISKALNSIKTVVSASMLALGVILVLTNPALIPLGIGLIVAGLGNMAATTVDWDFLANKASEIFGKIWDVAKNIWQGISETINEKIGKAREYLGTMSLAASEQFQKVAKYFSDMGGKLKEYAKTAYDNMVNAFSNAGTKFKSIADTVKSKLESAFSTLKTTAQTAWNNAASVFDNNSSMANKIISFFRNIKAVISPEVKLPNITGYMDGGQIRWDTTGGGQVFVMYDKGTNFVPNDQLALLHRGEAVIPADFNGTQGSPFVGSEETNDLLREFMNLVNNKDFKAVISQREVGQASVDYIHQQSRIMGGSIV